MPARQPVATVTRQPTPVVLDHQRQLLAAFQPHPAVARTCVPHRVRHRLGRDPVGRHLDRGRQVRQGTRGLDRHLQPATGLQPLADQPHCTNQAQLVEGRRPEAVHEPADVGHCAGDLGPELVQQPLRRHGIGRHQVLGRLGPERDRGECRSKAVVQVAS